MTHKGKHIRRTTSNGVHKESNINPCILPSAALALLALGIKFGVQSNLKVHVCTLSTAKFQLINSKKLFMRVKHINKIERWQTVLFVKSSGLYQSLHWLCQKW